MAGTAPSHHGGAEPLGRRSALLPRPVPTRAGVGYLPPGLRWQSDTETIPAPLNGVTS